MPTSDVKKTCKQPCLEDVTMMMDDEEIDNIPQSLWMLLCLIVMDILQDFTCLKQQITDRWKMWCPVELIESNFQHGGVYQVIVQL